MYYVLLTLIIYLLLFTIACESNSISSDADEETWNNSRDNFFKKIYNGPPLPALNWNATSKILAIGMYDHFLLIGTSNQVVQYKELYNGTYKTMLDLDGIHGLLALQQFSRELIILCDLLSCRYYYIHDIFAGKFTFSSRSSIEFHNSNDIIRAKIIVPCCEGRIILEIEDSRGNSSTNVFARLHEVNEEFSLIQVQNKSKENKEHPIPRIMTDLIGSFLLQVRDRDYYQHSVEMRVHSEPNVRTLTISRKKCTTLQRRNRKYYVNPLFDDPPEKETPEYFELRCEGTIITGSTAMQYTDSNSYLLVIMTEAHNIETICKFNYTQFTEANWNAHVSFMGSRVARLVFYTKINVHLNEKCSVRKSDDNLDHPKMWAPNYSQPILNAGIRDQFLITDETSVSIVPIACHSLFVSCDSLLNGDWGRPMHCAWCLNETNSRAIIRSTAKNQSCSQIFTDTCPPKISHAGKNRTLSNTSLHIQNPSINLTGNDSAGIISTAITIDSIINNTSTDIDSTTNSGKHIGIAVLSVLVIIVCLLFVIWNEKRRRKNNLRDPVNAIQQSVVKEYDIDQTCAGTIGLCDLNVDSSNRDYARMFKGMENNIKINVEKLQFETEIGRGNFGVVNRALYTRPDGVKIRVACKMLLNGIGGVSEFLNEGLTMSKLNHIRVVQLIGISFTPCNTPIIITKYIVNGDLVKYLRNKSNLPTLGHLMRFAIQIAEGMTYLHSMKFVHRDLAARNCMLDETMQIKIADFGLSRYCSEKEYYKPRRRRALPFKWMPIESLCEADANFTFQGDVWSYGIVLWELMTRANTPYGSNNYRGVLEFLKQGKRLVKPQHCPPELYNEVMLKCWAVDIKDRPSFNSLVHLIQNIFDNMMREVIDTPYVNVLHNATSDDFSDCSANYELTDS